MEGYWTKKLINLYSSLVLYGDYYGNVNLIDDSFYDFQIKPVITLRLFPDNMLER